MRNIYNKNNKIENYIKIKKYNLFSFKEKEYKY